MTLEETKTPNPVPPLLDKLFASTAHCRLPGTLTWNDYFYNEEKSLEDSQGLIQGHLERTGAGI
jgi:hypothetical protein